MTDLSGRARLPARLQAALDLLPPVTGLADVGCDHARLAFAAVAQGRAERAIGVDVSRLALARARRWVSQLGLHDRVELREGDGCDALRPGEVQAVVIAGVGGRNLLAMVERRDPRALGCRWLVTQPNRDEGAVRRELGARGWGLVAEALPSTPARVFPTMLWDAEAPARSLDAVEALLGPELLRARPAGFERLVERWLGVLSEQPETAQNRALRADLGAVLASRPGPIDR
jgi:tRNA (adenine22-N1)-methyltransferase